MAHATFMSEEDWKKMKLIERRSNDEKSTCWSPPVFNDWMFNSSQILNWDLLSLYRFFGNE